MQYTVSCIFQYFARPEGGGHTRGFRQKTIPDRREFDKLMESGSRVHRLWPRFDAPSGLKGGDLDKNWLSLGGDLDFKHFKMSNSPGSARRPHGRVK